jgi:hypothetical protein
MLGMRANAVTLRWRSRAQVSIWLALLSALGRRLVATSPLSGCSEMV